MNGWGCLEGGGRWVEGDNMVGDDGMNGRFG